jgi:hypothetical protein
LSLLRERCAMPDCALSTKFARAYHFTYLSTVLELIVWVFSQLTP